MMKPSPYVLPLSCGLLVFMLWMPCFASGSASLADTTKFNIELLPATAATPMKLSIAADAKLPTNIRLEWQVLLNGLPGQKGVFPAITIAPHHPTLLRLPLKLPADNEEAWLRVTCRHAHTTYTRLLQLRPWHGDQAIPPTGELSFTDSNNIFTITAPNTLIEFDKQTGWLLHYEIAHTLLMNDTAGVTSVLWPAIPPRLQLFSTSTGPQLVIVRAEYTIPETASLLHLSYTVNAAGDMLVSQILEPDTTQHLPDSVHIPALAGFGMRWLLPAGLDTLTWFGKNDSAMNSITPPEIVHQALTPAIDTRETRWLTVTGRDGAGFRIGADSSLLQTKTISVTDSSTHTARTLLQLDAPADSTRQYYYKLTFVRPAKPF